MRLTRRGVVAGLCGSVLTHIAPATAQTILDYTTPIPVNLRGLNLRKDATAGASLSRVLPVGPAIVHVWATWCAPCRAEMPEIARFAGDLNRAGLGDRLVLISIDAGDYVVIDRFLHDDLGLVSLSSYQDPTGRTGDVFRLRGFPSTILLNGDRRMVSGYQGKIDWNGPAIRAEFASHLGTTL